MWRSNGHRELVEVAGPWRTLNDARAVTLVTPLQSAARGPPVWSTAFPHRAEGKDAARTRHAGRSGGCLPSAPCQPHRKAESTEIPPALPGLGCRLRAEAIALCARRGPSSAEPTAGADAQWPREAAGAAARSGSLQASGARKQTPRPRRHRFGSEPHN